mmetsp:Transcript_31320/g.61851  ORF Transcript_31320/g.61851 Transcript_31320/m.61851 type:complete len:85 (-) Transcript_31320:60-314(-)
MQNPQHQLRSSSGGREVRQSEIPPEPREKLGSWVKGEVRKGEGAMRFIEESNGISVSDPSYLPIDFVGDRSTTEEYSLKPRSRD